VIGEKKSAVGKNIEKEKEMQNKWDKKDHPKINQLFLSPWLRVHEGNLWWQGRKSE
jgi:hypothetical protein